MLKCRCPVQFLRIWVLQRERQKSGLLNFSRLISTMVNIIYFNYFEIINFSKLNTDVTLIAIFYLGQRLSPSAQQDVQNLKSGNLPCVHFYK